MASINYNDKRFTQVEADKKVALDESNKTFDGMINQSDGFYQAQIDAANQWGATQEKLQQEQTDFTIEKIEQEKQQAYKDYQKEGSAAYVDWQKQSDNYGSNAEKMASSGLASSGFSESSQVAMYNQYQNRVMAAREVYNKALINFNNGITEARLQNSSALAEIRFKTLQTSLELGLQGFQYNNTLLQQKAQAKRDIDNTYYARYQDVVSQINHENSMAEQQRQFNLNRELELKKYNESVRQFNANLKEQQRQFNENLAWQKKKANVSGSGGGGGGSNSTKTKKQKDKKESTTDTKTTKSSKNAVSPKEVINLGYGPISDKAVKNLVQSGAVEVVKKNGKSTLQKTPIAPKKLNNTKAKPTVTSLMKRMFG